MNGETRLKASALWAAIAMLAGIGIVEALDQFGAPPELAAFFPLLPLAVAMIVAARTGSLAFGDMIRGGGFGSAAGGWAIAGFSTGTLSLIASPMATALGGFQGLLLLAALIAGLALSAFLLVPALRRTGAATLAGAIGNRFGGPTRPLAAIAIVLALLPLFAAEASLAGLVGSRMLGIPAESVRDALIALAAVACLIGGVRAAFAMAAISAPIVAVAYLTPVSIVSLDTNALPMPWAGLVESLTSDAPTRLSATVFLALIISLTVGVATLPTLLLPAFSARKRPAGPRGRVIGFLAAAIVILAAPSYAVFGAGLGIDATTNPAGLVINFAGKAGLSATPSVLLIGGLLTAALVSAAAFLATAAAAVGNDLYVEFVERSAPEGRRIFIARLAMLLIAGLAAALCRATHDDIALLAASGLSIAAASLGPLLLVGWPIRRVGSLAAAASLSVGLWLTVADIGLAVALPDIAGRFIGMGTVVPTVLGPTGWFRLPVGLSGLTGVVFGVITLWAVTELPRTDWQMLGRRLRRAADAAIATVRGAATRIQAIRPSIRTVPAASLPTDAAPSDGSAATPEPPEGESSTLASDAAGEPVAKPVS